MGEPCGGDFDSPHAREALKQRDREAWGVLIAQMQKPLYARIRRALTGRPNCEEDAKDLVQQTWVRAYLYIDSLEEHMPVHAWLFIIARNVVRTHFKKEMQYRQGQDAWRQVFASWCLDALHAAGPERQFELQNLLEAVERALKKLPPGQRQAWLAAVCGEEAPPKADATPRQLARLKQAYYTALHRAWQRLRHTLQEHILGRESLDILEWSERQPTSAQVKWVRHLVTQLLLTLTQPKAMERRVSFGRSGGSEITALVLDTAGQPVVDAAGYFCTVRFAVLRADIDRERGLFVQLATTEAPYCQPGGAVYTVQVALQHGAKCLRFPPVPLCPGEPNTPYPSGVATIRAKLGVAIAVPSIPLEALRLTVRPASSTSPGQP